MAVSSSLARVTCETRQVLLAGGQEVILKDLPFSPCLTSINGVRNHYLVREISMDDELRFYVPFKSYQDTGMVNMKGSVQ